MLICVLGLSASCYSPISILTRVLLDLVRVLKDYGFGVHGTSGISGITAFACRDCPLAVLVIVSGQVIVSCTPDVDTQCNSTPLVSTPAGSLMRAENTRFTS